MEHSKAESTKSESTIDDCSTDEFIGATVHELNNFLSSISGFAELGLLDAEPKCTLENYLQEILESVSNNHLFNQRLLLMAGRLPLSIKQHKLSELMDLIQQNSDMNSDISECTLSIDLDWMKCAFIDIKEFVQSQNMHYEIDILLEGQTLNLIWKLSSPQFSLDIEKLFQPYYTSKVLCKSKGIGLAWLPRFFTKQQIELSIEDKTETGFTFLLKIPVHYSANCTS